jgi:hypothetical protein
LIQINVGCQPWGTFTEVAGEERKLIARLAQIGRLWPYFIIVFSAVLSLAWSAVLASAVAYSVADGAEFLVAAIHWSAPERAEARGEPHWR